MYVSSTSPTLCFSHMKVFDNVVADSLVYTLQTVNFLCHWDVIEAHMKISRGK